MNCPNCSSVIADGLAACPYCGVNLAAQPQPQQPTYQDPYAAQPQPQQPPYQNPYGQAQPQQPYPDFGYQQPYQTGPAVPSAEGKKAKTLSIVALVFSFFFPIVAWICGGIGMSKANKVLVANPADIDAGKAKKLATAAIIISIINAVLGAIMNVETMSAMY